MHTSAITAATSLVHVNIQLARKNGTYLPEDDDYLKPHEFGEFGNHADCDRGTDGRDCNYISETCVKRTVYILTQTSGGGKDNDGDCQFAVGDYLDAPGKEELHT